MVSLLNELLSLSTLIWLLPLTFFIHDGEEIVTMEKWLRNNQDHPRIAVENRLLDWNKHITLQFTVAVLLLGTILCLITYVTSELYAKSGELNVLFTGLVAILLLDGVKHVGFSLALKKYSSGVITAIFAEIPYGVYALYRFYDAGAIDVMKILYGIAIGLPLTIFLVWLGLVLGRTVAPYRNENRV